MTSFKYRPDIDGLRALAVLLVVFFHANLAFPGGYIGVDVFFVISGFLITGLILKEQASGGFRLTNFWERRIRRILPASVCVVAATLLAGLLLLTPPDLKDLSESAIYQQLILSNVFFWRNTGYFDGPAELKPLLHTWSLAVEEQFYLFYPFLLVLLRKLSRQRLLYVLGLLFIASFLLSEWGVQHHRDATFFLLPTRAWELLLGGMLVLLPPPEKLSRRLHVSASWLGLVSIVAAAVLFDSATRFPGKSAVIPCIGAAALIYFNSCEPTFVARVFSYKPIVFVGLISYSLYLWHWPIFAFLRYWTGDVQALSVRLLAIVLSIALAIVSWRFVETPFRRNRKGVTRSRLFSAAGLSTLTILITALYIDKSHGLPGRLSEDALRIAETALPKSYKVDLRTLNDGSLPLLGRKEGDVAPSFLLWGDSHLRSVASLCDQLASEYGITGAIATNDGVPPLLDAWCVGRDRDPCVRWNTAVRAYIERRNIKNVVLIARWSIYIEGNVNGHKDMLIADQLSQSATTDSAKAAFERGLRRTIASLEQNGIRVWIMHQVPFQEFDPTRRLQLASILGVCPPHGSSQESNQQRHRHVNDIFGRLQSPTLRLLDPSECCFDSDGNSIIFDGERSLYHDDNHLSARGAEHLLRPLLTPVFCEIAREADAPRASTASRRASLAGNVDHRTLLSNCRSLIR